MGTKTISVFRGQSAMVKTYASIFCKQEGLVQGVTPDGRVELAFECGRSARFYPSELLLEEVGS